jgi:hypothetical protein
VEGRRRTIDGKIYSRSGKKESNLADADTWTNGRRKKGNLDGKLLPIHPIFI